jgi:hypothetical protein
MAKTYQCANPGYNLAIDQNNNPWNQETDEKKQRVIASAGILAFHPVTEPLTNTVFGELDSANPIHGKRITIATSFDREGKILGTRPCTPEEIENIIEASGAFKNCRNHKTLGARGIWDKKDRQKQLQQEVGSPGGVTPTSVFDKMSNAVLKLHIETEGGKYPMEDEHTDPVVYHAELVRIAVELETSK